MVIVFTKDAEPVSDYEIEDFYTTFKNSKEIHICNSLVLMRFRVGVVKGEIENFTIRIKKEDGTNIDIINNPKYSDVDNIFGLLDKYLDTLVGV